MMRRLRELDRLDAAYGLGAAPLRRTTRRRLVDWLPFVAVPLAMVTIAFLVPGAMPAEISRLFGLGPDRLAPAVDVAGVGGAAAVPDRLGKPPQGWRHHPRHQLLRIDVAVARGGRAAQRAVILHELEHLVGLAQVDDDTELMAARGPASDYGPGDREGLAILGQGDCD